MSTVLDLNVYVSEPKVLKLGDKEFDLTDVPFGHALRMYELIPIIQKFESDKVMSAEDADKISNTIADILVEANDTVDRKWVLKRLDMKRFTPTVDFIFKAIFDDGKKNGEEKQA